MVATGEEDYIVVGCSEEIQSCRGSASEKRERERWLGLESQKRRERELVSVNFYFSYKWGLKDSR